jgi:hypothetical protein
MSSSERRSAFTARRIAITPAAIISTAPRR